MVPSFFASINIGDRKYFVVHSRNPTLPYTSRRLRVPSRTASSNLDVEVGVQFADEIAVGVGRDGRGLSILPLS